jgi:hypothetical protein
MQTHVSVRHGAPALVRDGEEWELMNEEKCRCGPPANVFYQFQHLGMTGSEVNNFKNSGNTDGITTWIIRMAQQGSQQ